jgi:hypothetical protein
MFGIQNYDVCLDQIGLEGTLGCPLKTVWKRIEVLRMFFFLFRISLLSHFFQIILFLKKD